MLTATGRAGPSGAGPSPDLEEAYGVCERIVRGHYENFPVASLFMPKASRRALAAVYAFARRADDYADEGYGPGGRRRRGVLPRSRTGSGASGGRAGRSRRPPA